MSRRLAAWLVPLAGIVLAGVALLALLATADLLDNTADFLAWLP